MILMLLLVSYIEFSIKIVNLLANISDSRMLIRQFINIKLLEKIRKIFDIY